MDLDQLIQHIWGEGYNEPCDIDRVVGFLISVFH